MSATTALAQAASSVEFGRWVRWSLSLTNNNGANPFAPDDGGTSWEMNQIGSQQDRELVFLAALAATEDKPDPREQVSYNDGKGNRTKQQTVQQRKIQIDRNDRRKYLFVPILTEAACKLKYPNRNLQQVAADIINKEDGNKGSSTVFLSVNGSPVDVANFRVPGSLANVSIPADNVFFQTPDIQDVAFDGYVAKVEIISGETRLKFHGGKAFYNCDVEYVINK